MGVIGSRWVEETYPFSSPDHGIVGPDSVAYPLDLECGTAQQHGAEVEAWIYDAAAARSQPVVIYQHCISVAFDLHSADPGQEAECFGFMGVNRSRWVYAGYPVVRPHRGIVEHRQRGRTAEPGLRLRSSAQSRRPGLELRRPQPAASPSWSNSPASRRARPHAALTADRPGNTAERHSVLS